MPATSLRHRVLGDTLDFDQIEAYYYRTQTSLNPGGLVPAGPDVSGWFTAHHREELGGRPFGRVRHRTQPNRIGSQDRPK